MSKINLKPTHKAITEYHESLHNIGQHGLFNEGNVSPAFATLLDSAAKQIKGTLVQQYPKKIKGKSLRIDGAVVDQWGLPFGYWEAKDKNDDLKTEIKKKFAVGYPRDNIIFQEPAKAILYQNEKEVGEFDLLKPEELVRLLERFFDYEPPAFEEWVQAEAKFREQLPELGEALLKVLDDAKVNNKAFQEAFAAFYELCRSSINPNLSEKAVEEMLIQHILTERIFRTVFRNSEFTSRNVIAKEIEQVILALTSESFSREEFLSRFDHFYKALEHRANAVETFAEKQTFLNNVYERFFQGFAVDVADTHGIVYTPQPIVNFMVRSVEEILQKEFGKSLSDENVHILDPFVGTGNFIIHIIDAIKKTSLEHKYRHELHCNEVMLLPYYIASMNIEHEYFEQVGKYEPFGGICLVDTFDMEKTMQIGFEFVTEENTERINKQRSAPITVVIGNPPYNVGQVNENDNNKNRKYEEVDGRVAETYAKDSTATLKSKLGDPYVKAFRWASDRIGKEGIVAFVSNNSFLRKTAFDGMRKHLAEGFDALYILNLGGNVYENPKLSGTAHNVFGIKVGVSINILIKKEFADGPPPKNSNIFYAETDEFWRREKKYTYLDDAQSISGIYWRPIRPDAKYDWFSEANSSEFEGFLSLGNKESKAQKKIEVESIFHTYSLGISTNRDATVYDFDRVNLAARIQAFVATFKSEIIRYREAGRPENLDNFLNYDDIKWSETLKRHMVAGRSFDFSESIITETMYRPFTKEYLYLTDVAVDRPGHNRKFFPGKFNRRDAPNAAIGINGVGSEKIFTPFVVDKAPNLAFLGGGTAWQCFPFYVYDKGKHENITGWALEKFRENYNDTSITKWDIFYYTYAILHHPEYREKYAANLKRELPRIPFAPAFWSFAKAGKELADIHVNYEDQPEYKLDMIESGKLALDWRVERMKYNKEKTAIVYNDFLIIGGIPPEVHNYRLGNRSALDWIVDQYKVSTDTRSGITNDPNRDDDPQYIVRLIKKIITVSLRTNAIVHNLRDLSAEESGR